VTAIASNPQRNLHFYTEVLGLRLVKRTVNFDDPGTYHFYFADATGTPGMILTFFPWPGALDIPDLYQSSTEPGLHRSTVV
jgi:glyoxalase family protein